ETLRFNTEIGNQTYPADTVTRRYTYRGSDNVLQFDQQTALNDQLSLDLGLAAVYAHRESEVTYPVASPKINQYEWDFAPRLGMTYQPNESVQCFANLSRSIEPAHPWAMEIGRASRRERAETSWR